MSAAPLPHLISVYEYLHSDYEPDMDYIDGSLEERNLGERDHADIQTRLAFLLLTHAKDWQIKVLVEQRVQVSPTRFRVPDVCVLSSLSKRTPIVSEAPLLCIEVLSPEDRLSRMFSRCGDYFALGVPEVWIFDPEKRNAMVVRQGTILQTTPDATLTLEGTRIALSLPEVFAVLDEQ